MTQEAIKKIEKQIRKDGSLPAERKTELLSLLATIMPEMTKLYKSQIEYARSMIQFSKNNEVGVWNKSK